MNLWEAMTGSDLTRDWRAFEARAAALPEDYQHAWEQIKAHLMLHGNFTGRSLTPIVGGVLGLLETTSADGESVQEAVGEDLAAFCAALVGDDRAVSDYRQGWREQLNRTVARKLSGLEH